jgi:hypothetical protein
MTDLLTPTVIATLVSAIGPAHGAIEPMVARDAADLAAFADRFGDSIEVYSPDPRDELLLLAPALEPGHVALLFAPEGCGHADAELVLDGATVRTRLLAEPEYDRFRCAHPVRYAVGFVVAAAALPAGYRLEG